MQNAAYLEQINTYKKLKQALNNTVKLLLNSTSSIDDLGNTIKKEYNVDGDSTHLVVRCQNLKRKISEQANYILNTIIPTIDIEIRNIEKQMAAASNTTSSSGNEDLSSKVIKGIINSLLK